LKFQKNIPSTDLSPVGTMQTSYIISYIISSGFAMVICHATRPSVNVHSANGVAVAHLTIRDVTSSLHDD